MAASDVLSGMYARSCFMYSMKKKGLVDKHFSVWVWRADGSAWLVGGKCFHFSRSARIFSSTSLPEVK